jgi:hypothetical protein
MAGSREREGYGGYRSHSGAGVREPEGCREPGKGVVQRSTENGEAVEERKGARRRDVGSPSNAEEYQRS